MGYSYLVFAAVISAVISQSFCLRSVEVIELRLCTHLKGRQHRELADELKRSIGSKPYMKLLAKCLLLKNRIKYLLEANLENVHPVAFTDTSPEVLDHDNLLTKDIESSDADIFYKRQVRSGRKKSVDGDAISNTAHRIVKRQVRGGKRGVSHRRISQFGDERQQAGNMLVDGERETFLKEMYHGLDGQMEANEPQISGEYKTGGINGGKVRLSSAHFAQVGELVESAEDIRSDLKEWLLRTGVKQKDTEF
eukprot:Seg6034.2 transcript_id=Seg6034.2/GoldUCD/mRNA.D3Y31 product="hypothetical protein" protein_id=Seg6034.2/GoldUCD/D3Y31